MSSKRMLALDGHPLSAQIVARLLAHRGFQPLLAADGCDALDWLAAEHFDALAAAWNGHDPATASRTV